MKTVAFRAVSIVLPGGLDLASCAARPVACGWLSTAAFETGPPGVAGNCMCCRGGAVTVRTFILLSGFEWRNSPRPMTAEVMATILIVLRKPDSGGAPEFSRPEFADWPFVWWRRYF